MAPRKARPRQSRLSLQALTAQLKQRNEELQEALETIADVLEDVGILAPEEEEDFEPVLDADDYLDEPPKGEEDPPLPPKQSEDK
ncbi:MAG TPA: hypothetical protein VFS12_05240 [Terriglobia bacterium]|nr:hypothetical protein [Terriglobia bacterium]